MRLVTYTLTEGARPFVGAVEGGQVVRLMGPGPDANNVSMRDLIDEWSASSGQFVPQKSPERHSLTDVRLLAPLPNPPGNVICLGRNYAEHAQETARAQGEEVTRPTFFTKAITSIIGPYDDIPFDAGLSKQIDWEAELAVIIGRPAKNVPKEDALWHVFGYTVLNDVSARDLQYGYGGQFFYGKSLDGSCPMGPWIATTDEIPDPQDLTVRLRVDGVTKQDDSTRNMIFDVKDCISMLSRVMTLLPGQIISTGTPFGVGYTRTPAEYLQPGNVVETEVGGIGMLRNVVRGV